MDEVVNQNGSRWWKIDFHSHTPCSRDYKDAHVAPADWIRAAVANGLDAVVVMTRDAAYQVDASDITGPLDQQIRSACAFVKKNMRIAAKKDPAREELPQFSLRAVFEAVTNAVAHRDYSIPQSCIRLHLFSDRLELFSPGAIPNTMTIESMPYRQFSRNGLISSLLSRCPLDIAKEYGRNFVMDRRGEGIPIIIEETRRLSGKDPQFVMIDQSELIVTIPSAV